jgi:hypothetical protein
MHRVSIDEYGDVVIGRVRLLDEVKVEWSDGGVLAVCNAG